MKNTKRQITNESLLSRYTHLKKNEYVVYLDFVCMHVCILYVCIGGRRTTCVRGHQRHTIQIQMFPFVLSHPVAAQAEEEEPIILDEEAWKHLIQRYDSIDEDEHARILNCAQHHDDVNQTATEEWLKSRENRVTGSRMGAIGFCNPFCSADACLKDMLWRKEMDQRGQDNCKWGNLMEPHAEEAFVGYMMTLLDERDPVTGLTLVNFHVENFGLFVCKAPGKAYLAMSPDGVLYSTWRNDEGDLVHKISLIEYKCPVPSPVAYDRGFSAAEDDIALQQTQGLFDRLDDSFEYFKTKWGVTERRTWRKKCMEPGLYKNTLLPVRLLSNVRDAQGEWPASDWVTRRKKIPVPAYYNAQVQYGMEIFRLSGIIMEECYFVVHTPVRTAVTVVPRDKKYGEWLVSTAETFWKERYTKNLILKEQGKLTEEHTLPY